MAQGNLSRGIFSFLYGVQMTFTGNNGQAHTVFETGYTLDLSGGNPTIRPTTPEDTAFFMSLLSPGGGTGTNGGTQPPGSNGFQQANYFEGTYDETINEATATQIQAEIDRQIENVFNNPPPNNNTNTDSDTTTDNNPPPQTQQASFGYAGGVYTQFSGSYDGPAYVSGDYDQNDPAGTLSNLSPTEVGLFFDSSMQSFKGADFTLYFEGGTQGAGGAEVTFVPTEIPEELQNVGLFAGIAGAGIPNSITIFNNTTGDPPQFSGDPATLISGGVVLVGTTGAGEALCETCGFLNWGAWASVSDLNFQENAEASPENVRTVGQWVTGDVINDVVGALPPSGSAYYAGNTIASVAALQDDAWKTYVATGKVNMDWNFGDRKGTFRIRDFDTANKQGGYNFTAPIAMPGSPQSPTGQPNKFTGNFNGAESISGGVTGSFVKGPGHVAGRTPAGTIGNWYGKNATYRAGGIFGAGLATKPN